ncbi:GIY-YIG nuclease family protein [Flagellimonas sp.]|uniref:GIY-YIG nuclease family protein n=1 Tax=Flagellimonas sp. TaxID=2058762 RepID=UPI003BAC3B44
MMDKYFVYILTNKNKTVLYTGVTNNLTKRLVEHNDNIEQGKKTFAAKYRCKHLLYYEEYDWIQEAIAREKEIKGWVRAKKLNLIKSVNPNFDFLEDGFLFT